MMHASDDVTHDPADCTEETTTRESRAVDPVLSIPAPWMVMAFILVQWPASIPSSTQPSPREVVRCPRPSPRRSHPRRPPASSWWPCESRHEQRSAAGHQPRRAKTTPTTIGIPELPFSSRCLHFSSRCTCSGMKPHCCSVRQGPYLSATRRSLKSPLGARKASGFVEQQTSISGAICPPC
jgi:hypothetical protein